MAVLAALAASSTAAANTPERSFGVWSNPKGSVHVRAEPCGDRMCGIVVWANDKAKADAARGGSPQLVGVTLFRDFERSRPAVWRGRVFVPDIRSEEHTSELQSLMRLSYAVFCLKKKNLTVTTTLSATTTTKHTHRRVLNTLNTTS